MASVGRFESFVSYGLKSFAHKIRSSMGGSVSKLSLPPQFALPSTGSPTFFSVRPKGSPEGGGFQTRYEDNENLPWPSQRGWDACDPYQQPAYQPVAGRCWAVSSSSIGLQVQLVYKHVPTHMDWGNGSGYCKWVVVSPKPESLGTFVGDDLKARSFGEDEELPLWTDDFSNIIGRCGRLIEAGW